MNRPGLNAGAFFAFRSSNPTHCVEASATPSIPSPHLASKPSSDWVIDCQGNMGRYLARSGCPDASFPKLAAELGLFYRIIRRDGRFL